MRVKKMHSAEEYTISIRLEHIEDEHLYVARVEELPDVEEYADTFEFARELALDTIKTTQKVFSEKGMPFPAPKEFVSKPAVSGRVSLRLPLTLHSQCIVMAEAECVSLNTYLIDCIRGATSGYDIRDLTVKIDAITEKVNSIQANNTWNDLYIQRAFEHVSGVKTFASKVKLARIEEIEEENATNKIRNFISGSFRNSAICY